MSNMFKSNLVMKLSGASHSDTMQLSVDGFPEGIKIDLEKINEALIRRRPLQELSNARIEEDEYEFINGENELVTNGEQLVISVKNKNFNSSNYQKGIVRPGHVDYPAYVKYGEKYDYRGGGEFSGRLMVLMCIFGEIAKTALAKYGVKVGSHLYQIGSVKDTNLDYLNVDASCLKTSEATLASMEKEIKEAKDAKNSLGGIVEAIATGAKVGLGENYFGGLEAKIASLMFSIPGAKEVSFGKDISLDLERGSTYNDSLRYEDGKVKMLSNNAGGINGGLANGAPIVVRVKFRPTSSIGLLQKSINYISKENIDLEITGQHDACFAYRCCPICEAMLAIAILDSYLEEEES